MRVRFERDRILPVLKQFYSLAHLRIGVYDTDCREIVGYPDEPCGYCGLIRQTADGIRRCLACDEAALREAGRTKSIQLYTCHAGLREACAPILVRGEAIGYIMIGQLRGETDLKISLERLKNTASALMLDEERMSVLFDEVPCHDDTFILSAAGIIKMCAAFISQEEMVSISRDEAARLAEEFINANYMKRVQLSDMCAALGIGKTALCKAVRAAYGVTAGELLTRRRMSEGERLLRETNKTVSQIAEECGIGDYNYFTKLFRKHYGLSPTHYRRKRSF